VGGWSASFTGRVVAAAGGSFARAWQGSLTGRALSTAGRALRAPFASSAFLSLRAARPRPLDDKRASVTLKVLSVPYRVLTRSLGEGACGRLFRRIGRGAASCGLSQGSWFQVAGAFLLGLGFARIITSATSGDQLGAAALALAGTLAIRAGPRVGREWREGMTGRLLGVVLDGLPPVDGPAAAGRAPASPREVQAEPTTPTGPASAKTPVRPRAPGRGPRISWLPTSVPAGLMLGLAAVAGGLAGAASDNTPLYVAALGLLVPLVGVLFYRAEAFLLVLAAFPWLDFAARRALGPGMGGAWDEALLVVIFAALGFGWFVLRRFEATIVPLTLPLGVAFVAACGSVLLNGVALETGVFALRVTFEPLLFFYAAYLLPKDVRWVRYAVTVFLVASVALALHGLYQYVTGAPMPKAWVDAQEQAVIGTRAFSIVENPNGLGAFLCMGALLSASLLFSRLRTAARVLMCGVFVVLVAGVVVTFSRGAWFGLAAGAVALAALAHRRLLAWIVGLGVISPVVLPEAVLTRISFGFSGAYIAKSLTAGRLLMWQAALHRAFEHPLFGLGLGTFGGTSAFLFGYSRLWVDNFYLQMAAEGGLILLGAFLWLLWRAGKGLVAAHADGGDPAGRAVIAGVFGGFVAVVVANVTASVWETLVVGQAFWFLAGMAASTARGGRSPAARLPGMGELWPGPEKSAREPRPERPAKKKDVPKSAGRGNRQQRRAAAKKPKR